MPGPWKADDDRWRWVILGALVVMILGLMFGGRVFGQGDGRPPFQSFPVLGVTTTDDLVKTGDLANHALRVNVVAGSGSGVSGTIGTAQGPTVAPAGAVDPSGFVSSLSVSNSGALNVTCDNCTSAPPTNFASAFPAAGAAIGFRDGGGMLASATVDNAGNIFVIASQGASNYIVDQGTNPWTVSGTVTANATGTITAHQGDAWTVSLSPGTSVSSTQGTSPWVVSGTVTATGTISAHQADTWTVNCSNCGGVTPTNYGQTFPSAGTAVGFKDGQGFLASATVDNAGFLLVTASQGNANATPWNVAGTVTATGTVTAHQGDTWTVGLSAGATVIATGTITAHQGDAWTVALGTGTNTIGSLAANQSVNLAQIGGTTTVTAGTSGLLAVGGPAATAAQASGNPVLHGGVFVGTASRSNLTDGQMSWVVTDKRGALLTTPDTQVTYRASTATAQSGVVVAPASNAPFFCIHGSSTKTVVVQRIRVTGPTLSVAAMGSIVLAKYSTRVSAGTATGLVAVRLDSATASATATNIAVYTAAPTPGNLLGPIAVRRLWMPITSTAAGSNASDAAFDHTTKNDSSGIYLRGTTEGVCTNFGVAPASAVTLGVDVEWTEE